MLQKSKENSFLKRRIEHVRDLSHSSNIVILTQFYNFEDLAYLFDSESVIIIANGAGILREVVAVQLYAIADFHVN